MNAIPDPPVIQFTGRVVAQTPVRGQCRGKCEIDVDNFGHAVYWWASTLKTMAMIYRDLASLLHCLNTEQRRESRNAEMVESTKMHAEVVSVTVMRETLASALCNASGLFQLCKDGRRDGALLHRADILREDFGKTIANLQTLNDTVNYEFGKDRELYVRQSETMLRASLAAVALFWNELVVLNTPEDDDFFRDPELIEMRRTIAERLRVMANASVRSLPVPAVGPTLSVRPELAGSPRFGEYVRNALSRLEEVSNVINELDLQVRGLEVKSGAIPLADANS
jgi:hypothetical protein